MKTRELKEHILTASTTGTQQPAWVSVRAEQWATLLALLIQAKQHCPLRLQREIRTAFRAGWS